LNDLPLRQYNFNNFKMLISLLYEILIGWVEEITEKISTAQTFPDDQQLLTPELEFE